MTVITYTVGMAEAKTNFSKITADINRTGVPVTVFKNNKPWVEIRPLTEPDDFAYLPKETMEAIHETENTLNESSAPTYKTAESLFEALGI